MKYLVNIIPLSKRRYKSVLTYTHVDSIQSGVFVRIPFQSGIISGIVLNSVKANEQKQFLRKLEYELRPISEVTAYRLDLKLFENLIAFGKKYISSLEDLLSHVLPKFMYEYGGDMENRYTTTETKIVKGEINFLYKPYSERLHYILNLITKKNLNSEHVILILPTNTHVREWSNIISKSKNISCINLHGEQAKNRQAKEYEKIYNSTKPLLIITTPKYAYIPFLKNFSYIVELANHPYYSITDFNKNWPDLPYVTMIAESLKVQCVIADSFPSLEFMAERDKLNYYALSAPHYLIPRDIDYFKSSGIKPNISHVFSTPTLELIKETLLNTDKTILIFTPFSGAYSCTLCSDCGFIFYCPTCKKNLTAFKREDDYVYACSRCSINYSLPALCPKCSSHRFSFYGFGPDNIKDEIMRSLDISDDEFLLLENSKHTKSKNYSSAKPRIFISNQKIFSHINYTFDIAIITTLAPLFSSDEINSAYNIMYYLVKIFESVRGRVIFEDETIHPYITEMLQKKTVENFLQSELQIRKKYKSPPYGTCIRAKVSNTEKDAPLILDYISTECEKAGIMFFKKHTYITISKSFGEEIIILPDTEEKNEIAHNFLSELVDIVHINVQ